MARLEAITGGETDVCVLAAVMDAVDAGYRVALAEDALCSVSDESHRGAATEEIPRQLAADSPLTNAGAAFPNT